MKLIVLGAKESGTGAALLGKKLGYNVFLSDSGEIEGKYKEILQKEAIPFEEQGHSMEKILDAGLVVKSPGIPDHIPVIQVIKQKGIEIISEIEFAGRNTTAKMICITGSNGKTTTTLLTHHLLKTGGIDAGLAGNIGKSLATQVAENTHPVYVVELSSFQLDNMYRFKPDVGIITNITPDHLDRYDYDFKKYIASKFRILQNMDKKGLFIYNLDCVTTSGEIEEMSVVPEIAAVTYESRTTSSGAGMEEENVEVTYGERTFRISKDRIAIGGRHNIYNAMMAILVALKMGVDDEKIAEGLATFPQVPHRMELVGEKNGVTYINDSKATNVDSAWYALESVEAPVIWIAGGTDKGNDYTPLVDLAKDKVKLLVCMGVDNAKLRDFFDGKCAWVDTHSLAEAMEAVKKNTSPGDTVLLSPCCASFDLFRNYEDRGDRFREAIKEILNPN